MPSASGLVRLWVGGRVRLAGWRVCVRLASQGWERRLRVLVINTTSRALQESKATRVSYLGPWPSAVASTHTQGEGRGMRGQGARGEGSGCAPRSRAGAARGCAHPCSTATLGEARRLCTIGLRRASRHPAHICVQMATRAGSMPGRSVFAAAVARCQTAVFIGGRIRAFCRRRGGPGAGAGSPG